jgi:hypothetical protein
MTRRARSELPGEFKLGDLKISALLERNSALIERWLS